MGFSTFCDFWPKLLDETDHVLSQCGTTWSQELIWQVVHGVDLEGGRVGLDQRFPFLEMDSLVHMNMFSIFIRLHQDLVIV